jgi:uroporphyrinogen-III decarboxylase
MGFKQQTLDAYKHKNSGYVPSFYTDLIYSVPKAINERPQGEDGYDWFGVHWTFVPEAGAPMPTLGKTKVITDITKWREQVTIPDLSKYDWAKLAKEETDTWDRENKLALMMIINGPFERSHSLMGFEDALEAMIVEPEAFQELIEAITAYKIELVHIIGKYYKPDILNMHDDYGSNDRMLMSPEMWRKFFKEPMKRIIGAVHEEGIIYEHHSCGYIEPIFDEFVEIGIDAIDPMQITNDWVRLKKKYQDKVTFLGGFDNQGVYDKVGVTEEEIRAETRRVYDLYAPGGSYVAFPLTLTFNFVPTYVDEHFKIAFNYANKG